VKVEDGDIIPSLFPLKDALYGGEGIAYRFHIKAADRVYHKQAVGEDIDHDGAGAGGSGRVVRRAEKALFPFEIGADFPLPPDVVAGGDNVGAAREQVFGGFYVNPYAVRRCVFAVDDTDVGVKRAAHRPELPGDKPRRLGSDYIADA